ncbi:MAG: DUF1449 family protein [Azoarcus sp.]|jgi:hypothetical protein|nr:DUF1449 family protein [Azoarcus sp.]
MGFSEAILSYPAAICTVLLGVVLLYWILALAGLVDYESGGPDLDIGGEMGGDADADIDAGGDAHSEHSLDGEPDGVGTLASYLIALGLGGVPFSVVVSLLALFSWVVCGIAALWLLPFAPAGIPRFIAGSLILIGAFTLAVPAAAICVRPMRKLFVTHNAISNAALVGHECVVLTGSVDETFGRAEVPARGAGYHIRVVAETPNDLRRGDIAIIIEYNESARLYHIAAKTNP